MDNPFLNLELRLFESTDGTDLSDFSVSSVPPVDSPSASIEEETTFKSKTSTNQLKPGQALPIFSQTVTEQHGPDHETQHCHDEVQESPLDAHGEDEFVIFAVKAKMDDRERIERERQ